MLSLSSPSRLRLVGDADVAQLAGHVADRLEERVDDHVHGVVEPASRSVSAIVIESTRNGMSSVTTSTTVWPPADQPCSGTVGVNTRTRAVPCGRVCASLSWEASAPYTSTSPRSTTSSGATCR